MEQPNQNNLIQVQQVYNVPRENYTPIDFADFASAVRTMQIARFYKIV